jgi:hypothetical protein
MTLRATGRIVTTIFIGIAAYYLIRFAAQVWIDGGLIASRGQLVSWRALFRLGVAIGAFSAAAAAFLLLRSPLHWRQVTCGTVLLLAAPVIAVLPFVGHFTQVDPCLNLGKSWAEPDSCTK